MGELIFSHVFHLTRSCGFRLVFLCFLTLWLDVIVPGHRRGTVTLPGSCDQCEVEQPAGRRACCAAGTKRPTPATPSPASRCALCFFAAALSPAVAVDVTHPPLYFCGMARLREPAAACLPSVALTYLGRAPPGLA